MFPSDELFSAVEPFISAAPETLTQIPASFEVEGFNHLPPMEVDTRMIIPANTHLGDIVGAATMEFSVAPPAAEKLPVPIFAQTTNPGAFRWGTGGPLPGESSFSFSVEEEVSQDAVWDAVAVTEEKQQWESLISSKEWRAVDLHYALCETKIDSICERVTSLYKEGSLPLNIKEESDIKRGFAAYFSDLFRFESNRARLTHIKRVGECVGNEKSAIWRELKGFMESY